MLSLYQMIFPGSSVHICMGKGCPEDQGLHSSKLQQPLGQRGFVLGTAGMPANADLPIVLQEF